jgi:AcrR family transcriptional regulator
LTLVDRSINLRSPEGQHLHAARDNPSTRDRIVETAVRLFHEQGFAATGISTICREAGVNPGSLYYFFPSKDSLLEAVLVWYQEHLQPLVMGPVETTESDPLERLFKLLAWYRSLMVQTECRMGCPVGNLALEVSDTHPQARPLIDANFAGWSAAIHGWLQAAGDRLPAHVNRNALSRFVLTVMEGGLMQARAAANLGPFDDSVEQLRAYIDALVSQAASDRRQNSQVKENQP